MKTRFHYTILTVFVLGGVSLTLLPSFFSAKTRTGRSELSASTIKFHVQQVTAGLILPLDMAFPGNGDMLVAEQTGQIRLIKDGKLVADPLLDIRTKLVDLKPADIRGLLGFTISPHYLKDRKIYVFYSAPSTNPAADHSTIVAEYTLSLNAAKTDANSGRILFTADEPGQGDNGGCLKFGPDGYLYIAMGDGGGGGDKHGPIGNAQNTNTLLGKILRINVGSDSTYTVPADNPFVGRVGFRPEIWAYGLRNPWRFSFNKATKQLFTCDVGEKGWEETDIIEKGGNYGWRVAEGNHCFDPALNCNFTGTIKPIAEYGRTDGICVIGGYIYNGMQLPAIKGKYVFADWTGPFYYLQKKDKAWQRGKVELQNLPAGLSNRSFAEDTNGELYLITMSGLTAGAIYKMVR